MSEYDKEKVLGCSALKSSNGHLGEIFEGFCKEPCEVTFFEDFSRSCRVAIGAP